MSVSEVVEIVGFGKAQLLMVATGGAVLFNRGVQMCLMSILTIPIAADLGLTTTQQGLLSTVLFLGMLLGTVASGWYGDGAGRRRPVVFGSISTVLVGCASAACTSFAQLLLARLCLGFAMALGDVPVTALLSEVTPTRWRIPMRAAAEGMFDLGYTYAAVLASCSDAYLTDLNWQRLMIITCIPPGVLGLSAAAFLPESPVFLASRGDSAEAMQIFESFRRQNGKPPLRIELEEQTPTGAVEQPQLTGALSVVFGPRYLLTTCVLSYAAFVLNIFYYGGIYAQPQVMTQGNGLPPGWEIVIGGPFDLIGIVVATLLAQSAPRKAVLMFSMAAAAGSITCFGYAGSLLVRTPLLEVMYQVGLFGFYWVPAVGFIVFGQLAVESYPTLVAATGGSVAFSTGRLGAMTAPLLFERVRDISGQWELFCYLASGLCAMAIVLLCLEAWARETARLSHSPDADTEHKEH
jgi:putative MFS transporter